MSLFMFSHFNLNERIQKALIKRSFSQPTEVQKQAIPYAIKGLDLFVTAPTGTGKTAAFLLPLIHNLLAKSQPGSGLQALIILPTRELATQTYKELTQFNSFTFFKSCLITGGEELRQQAAKLRKNPDIVVGTPGRLVEQLNAKQLILDDLQILVLDETDRILDMGFGDDVKFLLNNCPTSKQSLLFSATLGDITLQKLAKDLLNDPIEIHLNVNQPNANIQQQIILTDDISHKTKLTQWLLANESYKQAIVFTNTKAQAELLSKALTNSQTKHCVLHSDKLAEERKQTLLKLTQQHINILIATDLAARGLDIKNIELVINYDLPNSTEEYIHRIGRTGRMDNKGLAISLISHYDWKKLVKIEKELKQSLTKRTINNLKGKFQGLANIPPQHANKIPNKEAITTGIKSKKITKTPHSKKTSSLVNVDGFAPLKRKKD